MNKFVVRTLVLDLSAVRVGGASRREAFPQGSAHYKRSKHSLADYQGLGSVGIGLLIITD
ncbi:MAG: hypothetical protein RM022_007330 [Nostoc sp. EfeVER01]|uniref:hypothetical protein n=1 Tax=unclassified Nostoc TaxID=2593658 RepID=UPI002AD4E9F2|nr:MULTISPECIES: hypothetical protein [unclassified Nostoc]MDZ7948850.1 hypothetical protein [Nostoc sp. EfeVER01]MDZ7992362.1 hypothetical protein [Nostoc sp. EspVER01]